MKSNKASRAFQRIAESNIKEIKGIASKDTIEYEESKIAQKYKRLTHQIMLNEYGFNYKTEMEFDESLFQCYQELLKLADSYTASEIKLIKKLNNS